MEELLGESYVHNFFKKVGYQGIIDVGNKWNLILSQMGIFLVCVFLNPGNWTKSFSSWCGKLT